MSFNAELGLTQPQLNELMSLVEIFRKSWRRLGTWLYRAATNLGGIMEHYNRWLLVCARILMAVVFLLNGFGIINQAIPAREMMERGVPASVVRLRCWQGGFWRSSRDSASPLEFYPAGVLLGYSPSWFLQHSSRILLARGGHAAVSRTADQFF